MTAIPAGMSADEYAAGLLHNRRRIDTERAFSMALGHAITNSEGVAEQLLPDLGLSSAEISMQRMKRELAKQAQRASNRSGLMR